MDQGSIFREFQFRCQPNSTYTLLDVGTFLKSSGDSIFIKKCTSTYQKKKKSRLLKIMTAMPHVLSQLELSADPQMPEPTQIAAVPTTSCYAPAMPHSFRPLPYFPCSKGKVGCHLLLFTDYFFFTTELRKEIQFLIPKYKKRGDRI